MASLLFTILSGITSATINETAFSSTNFVFSRLADHGEEKRKRHNLAIGKLQGARDEWNEDRMKQLDFINKRLREKMKQGHTPTILVKQCLNTSIWKTNKAFTTSASIIRFLSYIRDPKKW